MPRTRPYLILLSVFVMMAQAACRHKPSGSPRPLINTKDSLLVYLMAGQSNMAGRGTMAPGDSATNPRILALDSSGKIVLAREPLHYYYHPAFAGLDCGMSFATSLLPDIPEGCKICLVPCAIGNTSLEEWLYDSSHGVRLYTNLITRARQAGAHGVLKGVLWHQGENNAEDSARARKYAVDFSAFVQKIRKDLGQGDLPFFAGTLADFCVMPYKDTVNVAIAAVARSLPKVIVVSLADLDHFPDFIHFNAPAQREMGRRFAIAARLFLQ